MRADYVIDARIAELRRTDRVGANAMALRYRGLCPACKGRAVATQENAVTSERTFSCRDCQWTATVTEAAWRSDPSQALRALVERAEGVAKAAQVAIGGILTQALMKVAEMTAADCIPKPVLQEVKRAVAEGRPKPGAPA